MPGAVVSVHCDTSDSPTTNTSGAPFSIASALAPGTGAKSTSFATAARASSPAVMFTNSASSPSALKSPRSIAT